MPTIPYLNKKGTRVPGTTTVIGQTLGWNKEALMYWAWKQGTEGKNYKDTSRKACDAGTIAHYLVEMALRNQVPDTANIYPDASPDDIDKATTSYLNFVEWEGMMKFKPLEMEPHMVSERYQYGLTPDCIAMVNDQLAIFDWKTSKGVYPDMLLQLAAYEHGWNECHPRKKITGGAYLLRISPNNASFHFHHWKDLSAGWNAFLHALGLYHLYPDIKDLL